MDHSTWLVSTLQNALAEALTLVLPVDCAGCGEPDIALCEACAGALAPVVTHREVDGVRVWSGLGFDGPAARVIRALKEDARTGLSRALAPALAAAVRGASTARGIHPVLVPVPTSRAALRRRGFHVVEHVARRADLRVERMLRHTRQTRDQRGLGLAERRRNVTGSMKARGAARGPILVIDDVFTTGATVSEAVRALRAAGCEVVGAVTIAATPRRSAPRTAPRTTAFETHR